MRCGFRGGAPRAARRARGHPRHRVSTAHRLGEAPNRGGTSRRAGSRGRRPGSESEVDPRDRRTAATPSVRRLAHRRTRPPRPEGRRDLESRGRRAPAFDTCRQSTSSRPTATTTRAGRATRHRSREARPMPPGPIRLRPIRRTWRRHGAGRQGPSTRPPRRQQRQGRDAQGRAGSRPRRPEGQSVARSERSTQRWLSGSP